MKDSLLSLCMLAVWIAAAGCLPTTQDPVVDAGVQPPCPAGYDRVEAFPLCARWETLPSPPESIAVNFPFLRAIGPGMLLTASFFETSTFDVSTGAWSVPVPRAFERASWPHVVDGRVLDFESAAFPLGSYGDDACGRGFAEFDLVSQTWTPLAPIPLDFAPGFGATSIVLGDEIFVAGGSAACAFDAAGQLVYPNWEGDWVERGGPDASDRTFVYRVEEDAWDEGPPLPAFERFLSTELLSEGNGIALFGGHSSTGPRVYIVDSNTLEVVADHVLWQSDCWFAFPSHAMMGRARAMVGGECAHSNRIVIADLASGEQEPYCPDVWGCEAMRETDVRLVDLDDNVLILPFSGVGYLDEGRSLPNPPPALTRKADLKDGVIPRRPSPLGDDEGGFGIDVAVIGSAIYVLEQLPAAHAYSMSFSRLTIIPR